MAGFCTLVEVRPSKLAKMTLIFCLAEMSWDTTYNFHIAGHEMTITPYDLHKLTRLRVDTSHPTFTTFFAWVRPNRKYLQMDLGTTSTNFPNLFQIYSGLPKGTEEERYWMVRAFLLYVIRNTIDYNTALTIAVRWLHLLVDL